MSVMGSQITSLTIVYSTVHSGADQRTHQSSGSLAFVRGIQRSPAGNAENVSIWWRHQTGRNYRSYVHDLQGKAANVNLGAIRVNSVFYWLTAEINIWQFILSAHHKAPYLMFPYVHSKTIFFVIWIWIKKPKFKYVNGNAYTRAVWKLRIRTNYLINDFSWGCFLFRISDIQSDLYYNWEKIHISHNLHDIGAPAYIIIVYPYEISKTLIIAVWWYMYSRCNI